jgi:hypothetical protein
VVYSGGDTEAPEITDPDDVTCGGSITVETEPGECTYIAGTGFDASATDNCSVTLTCVLTGATQTATGEYLTTLEDYAFYPGTTHVTWTATDDCGHSTTCSFDVVVQVATITTAYTSASSAHYYDDITLYAEVVTNCAGHTLTGTVQFYLDNVPVGDPVDAFIIPAGEPGYGTTLRATLIHKIVEDVKSNYATNPFEVKAVFTPDPADSPDYLNSEGTCDLLVYPREAEPFTGNYSFYTGPLFAWTTSLNSSTGTVTLSTVIEDNNVPDGDVRGAKVTFCFINSDGSLGSPIPSAQNLPVNLIDMTDGTVGIASAIVQLNIGNNNALPFDIGVKISGNYQNNPLDPESKVTITMAKPIAGGFITGGAAIFNTSNTAGLIKGAYDDNQSTFFSFDVKYNKSGTNPQGKAYITIYSWYKSDGTLDSKIHEYQAKSNAIASLIVNKPVGTAYFSSKANLIEVIRDPVTGNTSNITVEGNAKFEFWLTDPTQNQTNTSDGTIGIQLLRKAGGMWYSNKWVGGTIIQELFHDGGMYVGASTSSTEADSELSNSDEQFKLEVYPNPSSGPVNFKFTLPETSKVTLEIFNASGMLIERMLDEEVAEGIEKTAILNKPLPEGMYVYRLTYGAFVYTGKFIKTVK